MNLPEILRRIEAKLAEQHLSADRASTLAGKPDAIRNIKRAVKNPNSRAGVSTTTITALAKVLNCSPAWLMGEGNNLVSSFDPDAAESAVDPDAEPSAQAFPPDGVKELAAVAGLGSGQVISTSYRREGDDFVAQDAIRDDYWRLPPYFVREVLNARITDLLVIPCVGDSMEPTIHSGDRVVANTAHVTPSPDGLYAVRDAFGLVVIKRLESYGQNPPRIRIISDNPRHTPQDVSVDEIFIVGKVVFVMKLV